MYTDKYVEDFVDFDFPEDCRFMLWYVETKTGDKFVIAPTPQIAVALSGPDGGRPEPINLHELVQSWGHARTHNLLQGCEPSWIAKHNMVFFKNGPKVVYEF